MYFRDSRKIKASDATLLLMPHAILYPL